MRESKGAFVRGATVVLVLLAFSGLVLLPQVAMQAAKDGLRLCAGVIIPALFPFFVLSSLLVSLGIASALGRLLSPLMRPLFGVSGSGAGALVLGLIGGYPVGARTVRQLYESGQCSHQDAQRLLFFCNNCGFAFILGATGTGVFGSARIGCLLLVGQVLGAVTVGMLGRTHSTSTGQDSAHYVPVQSITLASALTGAVQSALTATLNVCGYVVLFSVLLGVLEAVGALEIAQGSPLGEALLRGVVELSNGITALSAVRGRGAIVTASFLLGFGGLSVQCQTLAMLEGSGLDVGAEVLGKLLHGVTAAGWTVLLLNLVPYEVTAMAVVGQQASTAWLPLVVTGASWTGFLMFVTVFLQIDSRKSR